MISVVDARKKWGLRTAAIGKKMATVRRVVTGELRKTDLSEGTLRTVTIKIRHGAVGPVKEAHIT